MSSCKKEPYSFVFQQIAGGGMGKLDSREWIKLEFRKWIKLHSAPIIRVTSYKNQRLTFKP